ncbi:hypothetical protein RI367_002718 [Sorochytrium milnesiophthora]
MSAPSIVAVKQESGTVLRPPGVTAAAVPDTPVQSRTSQRARDDSNRCASRPPLQLTWTHEMCIILVEARTTYGAQIYGRRNGWQFVQKTMVKQFPDEKVYFTVKNIRRKYLDLLDAVVKHEKEVANYPGIPPPPCYKAITRAERMYPTHRQEPNNIHNQIVLKELQRDALRRVRQDSGRNCSESESGTPQSQSYGDDMWDSSQFMDGVGDGGGDDSMSDLTSLDSNFSWSSPTISPEAPSTQTAAEDPPRTQIQTPAPAPTFHHTTSAGGLQSTLSSMHLSPSLSLTSLIPPTLAMGPPPMGSSIAPVDTLLMPSPFPPADDGIFADPAITQLPTAANSPLSAAGSSDRQHGAASLTRPITTIFATMPQLQHFAGTSGQTPRPSPVSMTEASPRLDQPVCAAAYAKSSPLAVSKETADGLAPAHTSSSSVITASGAIMRTLSSASSSSSSVQPSDPPTPIAQAATFAMQSSSSSSSNMDLPFGMSSYAPPSFTALASGLVPNGSSNSITSTALVPSGLQEANKLPGLQALTCAKSCVDAERSRDEVELTRLYLRHQERMMALQILNNNIDKFSSSEFESERAALFKLLQQ